MAFKDNNGSRECGSSAKIDVAHASRIEEGALDQQAGVVSTATSQVDGRDQARMTWLDYLCGCVWLTGRFTARKQQRQNEHAKHVIDDLRAYASCPIDDVHAKLQTCHDGLTEQEAEERLVRFGRNALSVHKPPRWYMVLLNCFLNPFVFLLAGLLIANAVLGNPQESVVLSVMIVLSVGIRFMQDMKSQVAALKLRSMIRNKITVVRRDANGKAPQETEIDVVGVVPGDIIRLSAGTVLPGDCRFIEVRDVFISQSALTGESLPVEKSIASHKTQHLPIFDCANIGLNSTSVVSGTASAIVLTTGDQTYTATIAERLTQAKPPSAAEIGVRRVSYLLVLFTLVITPITIVINGLLKHSWYDAVMFGLATAVGMTPEMLPMIVNANLARGSLALMKKRVIVKHLDAIQNMGAMDVLCTDKTGTLTIDQVQLFQYLDREGNKSEQLLHWAYLNAKLQTGLKNLLDIAIINQAEETLANIQAIVAERFLKIDELPFDFQRRRLSVIVQAADEITLVCKGAVEEMLAACNRIQQGDTIVDLTNDEQVHLLKMANTMNDKGLRVLALATKVMSNKKAGEFTRHDEVDLVFQGFLAFLDPPKETAAEAIRLLEGRGVAVKVLTGDNPSVSRKVCNDVGISTERMYTSDELAAMDRETFVNACLTGTVFTKLTPHQKLDVVEALQNNGKTVGFLGDGINDALALRTADVGISVDSGTAVAKEAADMILLEKSLLILHDGILKGRRTCGNTLKYIKITASSNFGNVFSVMAASIWLPFQPMTSMQILLQNLMYDLAQIAIPWDNMDAEYLRLPRQWSAKSIARFMVWFGPSSSIFDITTFLTLWFYFGYNHGNDDSDYNDDVKRFQTAWFFEGYLTQLLVVQMLRTEKIPFFQSRASKWVMATAIAFAAIVCYMPFSPAASYFDFVPPPPIYGAFLVATLVTYLLLSYGLKQLYIRVNDELI
ncbi:hypothetical protein RI367_002468 [Sorochytrium milnesiophthora]